MNLKLGLNYSPGRAIWLAPNGQTYEGQTSDDEHAQIAYELCFKFYKKDIPKEYTAYDFIAILLHHNWTRVSWFTTELYLEVEHFNMAKDAIIEYLSTQRGKSLHIEDWSGKNPRTVYKGTVDSFLDTELEKVSSSINKYPLDGWLAPDGSFIPTYGDTHSSALKRNKKYKSVDPNEAVWDNGFIWMVYTDNGILTMELMPGRFFFAKKWLERNIIPGVKRIDFEFVNKNGEYTKQIQMNADEFTGVKGSLKTGKKNEMDYLKDHKVPLTEEEKDKCIKEGATWDNGDCGIWKAKKKDGSIVYGCNTHRAYQVKDSLEKAIKAFDFIKTTSSLKFSWEQKKPFPENIWWISPEGELFSKSAYDLVPYEVIEQTPNNEDPDFTARSYLLDHDWGNVSDLRAWNYPIKVHFWRKPTREQREILSHFDSPIQIYIGWEPGELETESSLKFSWSNPESLLEDFPPNLSLDRKHPLQDTLLNDYKTVIFDPLNTIWKVLAKDGSALMASKTVPPYHLKEKGIVEDNKGNLVKLEHNVAPLISLLDLEGKTLGIVTDDAIPNRTKEAQPVVLLLRKFRLYDYFSYIEIDKRINYSEYVRPDGATLFITDNNSVGKEVNNRGQVDILQRQSFEDYVELLQPKEEQRNSVLSRLGYAIVKLVKKAWEPQALEITKDDDVHTLESKIKPYQLWEDNRHEYLVIGKNPEIEGGHYVTDLALVQDATTIESLDDLFPPNANLPSVYIIEYALPYKLISNDWRNYYKKYTEASLKLSNDTISGNDELDKYTDHSSDLSKEELKKIHKKDLGKLGKYNVWLVDAEYVRNKVDQDFTTGGNPGRYKFVPSDEIWIEDTMSPSDIVPCIVHEFIESVLMTNEGLTYDEAHEKANKVEQKVREQVSKYTGKDDILSFVKYALIDNKSLIEKEFKESSLKFSWEPEDINSDGYIKKYIKEHIDLPEAIDFMRNVIEGPGGGYLSNMDLNDLKSVYWDLLDMNNPADKTRLDLDIHQIMDDTKGKANENKWNDVFFQMLIDGVNQREASLKFSFESSEESAKRLGIEYGGPQKDRNGNVAFEWYQDPVTNGSFAVKPGETIDQKLQELRDKFKTSSLKLGWESQKFNTERNGWLNPNGIFYEKSSENLGKSFGELSRSGWGYYSVNKDKTFGERIMSFYSKQIPPTEAQKRFCEENNLIIDFIHNNIPEDVTITPHHLNDNA